MFLSKLVTMKTPTHERDNPKISRWVNCSFRIINAIKAETGLTKKNKVDVWFALLCSKSHISIKKAPSETANTCHDIARIKSLEKFIK